MTREFDAVSLLCEMVGIESVTGREHAILAYLERVLGELGPTLSRFDMGAGRYNLLASLGSGRPIMCLNAHCDTMPPSGKSIPRAVEEDGIVRGLGSCDDKASIAAMLTTFERLSRLDLRGRLDLLVSVDEEVSSKGVRTCVEGGYAPDFAIVGEPTDLAPIVAHSGLIFLDVWTRGKAGHGSSPWRGKNAILEMTNLYRDLEERVSSFPSHPLVGPASTNLGTIKGGDATNRIPTECLARIDIRVMPGMSVSSALEEIERLVKERGARSQVYKTGETFEAKQGSVLLREVADAQRILLGEELEPIGFRGWTEAEPLRNLAKTDCLVLGPGDVGVAHTEDEYVDLDQVDKATKIYSHVAKKILTGGVE